MAFGSQRLNYEESIHAQEHSTSVNSCKTSNQLSLLNNLEVKPTRISLVLKTLNYMRLKGVWLWQHLIEVKGCFGTVRYCLVWEPFLHKIQESNKNQISICQ